MSDIGPLTWVGSDELPESTVGRGGPKKWDAFVEALQNGPEGMWALAGAGVLTSVATRLRKYPGVEVHTVRTPSHAKGRADIYARYVEP